MTVATCLDVLKADRHAANGEDALYLRAIEERRLSETTQSPADVGTYRNALSKAVEMDDRSAAAIVIERLSQAHGRATRNTGKRQK